MDDFNTVASNPFGSNLEWDARPGVTDEPQSPRSESGSVSSIVSSQRGEVSKHMKALEEADRVNMITKIKRASDNSGIPSRVLGVDLDMDSLQAEFSRIHREISLRKSIKFQRRMLLTFSSGVEYMHNQTSMAGKLDGWGESVLSSIDDFDPVFQRLHDKHVPKIGPGGEGAKPPEPEIELLQLLAYNAFAHVVTTSIAKMATEGISSSLVPGQLINSRMSESRLDSQEFEEASETFTSRSSSAPPPRNLASRVLNLG